MSIHFNVWPGNANFGGNFDPAILPVHQYIGWVQYSSYQDDAFTLQWRDDFAGASLPSGWATGRRRTVSRRTTPPTSASPTVSRLLSLTAYDATGFTGTPPPDAGGAGGASAGSGGAAATGASGMGAGGVAASGGSAVAGARSGSPSACCWGRRKRRYRERTFRKF